jgi:hypothetical protein
MMTNMRGLPTLTPGMFGRPTGRAIIVRNGSDVHVWFRGTDDVVRCLTLGPSADILCPSWKHDDRMEVISQLIEYDNSGECP